MRSERFPKVVDDIDTLLTDNRIFKQRNVDIGVVRWKRPGLGLSGVMVRGSGAAWDLRKAQPYECYEELDFDIPVGKNGDCYDRYLRREEMRQSAHHEAVRREAAGEPGRVSPCRLRTKSCRQPARQDEALDGSADPSLQALHRGFQRAGRRGLCRRRGAKGQFGVYLVADGTNKPYRCKIRAPGFAISMAMDDLRGHMLADVSAIRFARHRVRGGRQMTAAVVAIASSKRAAFSASSPACPPPRSGAWSTVMSLERGRCVVRTRNRMSACCDRIRAGRRYFDVQRPQRRHDNPSRRRTGLNHEDVRSPAPIGRRRPASPGRDVAGT